MHIIESEMILINRVLVLSLMGQQLKAQMRIRKVNVVEIIHLDK